MAVHLQREVKGAAAAEVKWIESIERQVVWVEVDERVRRGALSADASAVIANAADTAREKFLPLILVIGSSGADIVEGVAALHAWGQAAKAIAKCSGIVPILTLVTGPAVSGPALLVGLADIVAMTVDAYAFVSGPSMVAEFTGIKFDNEQLGGADVHSRQSGVAHIVVEDRQSGIEQIEELLSFLPNSVNEMPPRNSTNDPIDRQTPEAGRLIPRASTGSYDIRNVVQSIADDGHLLELRGRWAPNIVTCLVNLDASPVGVIANQPINLAGTLDILASQKAARFVSFCDAFNIPILTLVDTPGFYPGKDLEWRGMIRKGAQLVFAYGRATVPRVCLVLRKSYGGAYIVMDSKKMGNDICLAWPTAELAVMGAEQASAILQRRANEHERKAFEKDYVERLLNPYVAAERGYIDNVIDPAESRREIIAAFSMLSSKREKLKSRRHDNSPL